MHGENDDSNDEFEKVQSTLFIEVALSSLLALAVIALLGMAIASCSS